jgi:hypothetical protein
MKKLLIALAAVVVATVASYGQGSVGQVQLANKGTGLDAPVTIAGTTSGLGPDWSAQLYLADASGNATTALTPPTTFRPAGTGPAAIANQYVLPVTVDVPGHAPGENVSFILRAWQTSQGSYAAAAAKGQGFGQSSPFTVSIGGGLNPPAALSTLTAFTVVGVPEPSVIALGVLGAAALALRRRK